MKKVLLLLLLLPALARGQSLKLPAEVKGEPGQFIRVPAETDGAQVRWYSPDRLNLFPVDLLRDSKTCVVTAPAKGRYRLIAWTAKGDVPSPPAETVVVVGDVPPGPGPGPGPNPPAPTDPLTLAVKAALAQETAPDKIASASKLADLYAAATEQVKSSDKTKVSEFHAALKQARIALIGEAVPLVRAEITRHLDGVLPRAVDAPLDAAARAACAKAFTDVAYSLRACCP